MLGAVGWDPAGLILIAGFALAVLAYHGVCWATLLLRRRWARGGRRAGGGLLGSGRAARR